MAKKVSVPDCDQNSKWAKRGFASKAEYIGWLQFNDLCDESMGYDDTYQDPYSGKTIRLSEPAQEDVKQFDHKVEVV